MKSKAVCFLFRRLVHLPISPPRHFNLFIYCITHYDIIILLYIYIILNNRKYRCSTLMFWFCFVSNRHENNYFLLIIFIRFALKMISARDPDKKRFHSFLSGLDPESRLFYFASLIKQTRVLGRPLFIFPPCEVGKIYSAASSPDASKIVCLLWAYFTS